MTVEDTQCKEPALCTIQHEKYFSAVILKIRH